MFRLTGFLIPSQFMCEVQDVVDFDDGFQRAPEKKLGDGSRPMVDDVAIFLQIIQEKHPGCNVSGSLQDAAGRCGAFAGYPHI